MALTPHKRIEMLAELKLKKISAKEALEEKLRHEKMSIASRCVQVCVIRSFLQVKLRKGIKMPYLN